MVMRLLKYAYCLGLGVILFVFMACHQEIENRQNDEKEPPSYYTVTFESNGGTEVAPLEVEQGQAFSFPLPPTRLGYTFAGWFLDNETFEQQVFASVQTHDITVYAKWLAPERWHGATRFFGMYPQTIKAEDVTVSPTQDPDGYYLGSDGALYVKVVASPRESHYTFSTGDLIISGQEYYFKVEPIEWKILSEGSTAQWLVSHYILDSQTYHPSTNYYETSAIRAWLNHTFYDIAFSDEEKAQILITQVMNHAYSTGYTTNPYASDPTHDHVFLLSYREATSVGLHYAIPRRQMTTDYSRSQGVWMNTGGFYGYGGWYLRSPSTAHPTHIRCISEGGQFMTGVVHADDVGTVPALRIRMD